MIVKSISVNYESKNVIVTYVDNNGSFCTKVLSNKPAVIEKTPAISEGQIQRDENGDILFNNNIISPAVTDFDTLDSQYNLEQLKGIATF